MFFFLNSESNTHLTGKNLHFQKIPINIYRNRQQYCMINANEPLQILDNGNYFHISITLFTPASDFDFPDENWLNFPSKRLTIQVMNWKRGNKLTDFHRISPGKLFLTSHTADDHWQPFWHKWSSDEGEHTTTGNRTWRYRRHLSSPDSFFSSRSFWKAFPWWRTEFRSKGNPARLPDSITCHLRAKLVAKVVRKWTDPGSVFVR